MNSKIILGTVQFGMNYGINNSTGQLTEDEVFNILDLVHKSNIHILDTAAAYGNSEKRIGNYNQSRLDKDFKIITKFNLKQGATPLESLENSLQNLKVDQVDTIMFHSFEDFRESSKKNIEKLIEQKGKKYLKLGISLYTNEQVDEICNHKLFEVVQLPFNALDNYNLRGKALEKLKANNIEIHTRSVFLQGLFFMSRNKIPLKLNPLKAYLEQLEIIAKKYRVEKAALALHYALSKTYIDGILIGVDSLNQMENNIKMLASRVPHQAFNEIDNIVVNESYLLNPAVWNH
ncbi:MAG: aldo/keto reductase [Chitinophagaceae bacterium]|nr:MAG: aldo/keto reductase [Chitinophagaceae bacterium]